ncbi:hypothetical protein [Streptomyces sp. NPDC001070]
MLQEVGYPIDDVAGEVERIQKRSFDLAARHADATGDNAAVREYQGLPEADPVPTVPLIPGKPDPGEPASAAQSPRRALGGQAAA